MPLQVKPFEFNVFGETTYVVWDEDSREAAIVDAGMSDDTENRIIDRYIADNHLTVKYLLNTHIHLDHVFGAPHVQSRYGVGISASPLDAPLAQRVEQQAVMFHLPFKVSNVTIEHPLQEGDIIRLGKSWLDVIEVPGHSPGGLAFYCAAQHFVLTGDSLFHSSIGRTDLPGGDHATLVHSVTRRLLELPGNTTVYPGHGPATTIAHERTFNPYL